MRSLLKLAVILACLPVPAFAQLWSNILAPSRATDWTTAGIPGGIPSGSWTQCGATIAAYGSLGTPGSPSTIINAMNHTAAGYTSCGSNTYVKLGAGQFWLNGPVYMHTSAQNNEELRGSGPQQTFLHWTAAGTCQNGNGSCLIGFASTSSNYVNGPGTVVNWTAGYSQGATSITLSDGSSITAHTTMIILDQCDTGMSGAPCTGSNTDNGNFFECQAGWTSTGVGCTYGGPGQSRPGRGQEETVEAVSCSPACGTAGSTVVTISPALRHPNWSSGQTPQAWFVPASNYVGIRDMSIDGANFFAPGNSGGHTPTVNAGFSFAGNAYSWVTNVVMSNMPDITLFATQPNNHLQVESNYFYNAGQSIQGDTTAVVYVGSNSVFQNNICQNSLICLIKSGPTSGNVYGYNFSVYTNTEGGNLGAMYDGHSSGEDLDLYEGNVGVKVEADQAHGTELANTFYRNYFSGWQSCANGTCGTSTQINANGVAMDDISNHRYWNIVGNVLGQPTFSTGYTFTNAMWFFSSTSGYAYEIGSGNTNTPPGVFFGPIPIDAFVATTVMRYGNWDASHGSTQWNSGEVPTTIGVYPNPVPTACVNGGTCPPSFYLSGRPSWWASTIPFPAIGPDVTGGNVGLCTGTFNTPGQYAGVPATSASQCTGTTLGTALGGHVNAIPAMNCYLNVLNGKPDGTSGLLPFDANVCYANNGVAVPVPSPLPGTFSGTQSVTATDSTAGATICYTNDGSIPTAPTAGTCSGGTTQTYTGAISVASTTTLNFIGTKAGLTNSGVGGGLYTISATQAATPTFSVSGAQPYGTPVAISTATSGCAPFIWWSSVNPPVAGSSNNSTSFSVIANVTIYAKVIGCPGFADSNVGSASYTVLPLTNTGVSVVLIQ